MVRTRKEACDILGVPYNADETQVKLAYKELVKRFHPDVTGNGDASIYNNIVEAYKFMCDDSQGKVLTHSRVMGKGTHRTTASNADYAAFQKKAKRQKEKRAQEFEKKQKELSAIREKQDADYKRAMEAVEAIRAARAIQAMVWANSLGKDSNDEE